MIERVGPDLVLRDLGSKNGTGSSQLSAISCGNLKALGALALGADRSTESLPRYGARVIRRTRVASRRNGSNRATRRRKTPPDQQCRRRRRLRNVGVWASPSMPSTSLIHRRPHCRPQCPTRRENHHHRRTDVFEDVRTSSHCCDDCRASAPAFIARRNFLAAHHASGELPAHRAPDSLIPHSAFSVRPQLGAMSRSRRLQRAPTTLRFRSILLGAAASRQFPRFLVRLFDVVVILD